MKKTLNISIASRLFNLEDDAYHKLDQYLTSIKSYFHSNADKDEIIADIEERIAEHFLESKTGIITVEDVESLIKTMGTVDQFEEPEEKAEEKTNEQKKQDKPKQLFRDTDDAIVAGVASGIAHYFAIDPIIPRIIFVISIFAGGTGIIVYIILWLVVPEAKTASQKLSMYGEPITLETISETARERLNEIKTKDTSGLRKVIALPFTIIGNIIKFLADFIPKIARYFFGSLLSIVSLIVLVFAMILSGFMASGELMIFENTTLQTFIPGFPRHFIILGAALAIMIPALFAFLGGLSLLKKKNMVTSYVGLSLLGIWLIALAFSGYGIAKVADRYETLVNTSPAYQIATETRALEGDFNMLEIRNGLDVDIVTGTSTSMHLRGTATAIDSVKTAVLDDKLTIKRERAEKERFCLFCDVADSSLKVTLTVTDPLASVSVLHGSSVDGDLSKSPTLDLNIENGSDADFTIKAESLTAHVIHGSRLTIEGVASSTEFTLEHGSVLTGNEFEAVDAKVTALHGSRADIDVSKTLDATAKHGSVISYEGEPKVTKNEAHGSRVYSENE